MAERTIFEKLAVTFAFIAITLFSFTKSNPAPENYLVLLLFAVLTGIFSLLNVLHSGKMFWMFPAFESVWIIIFAISKLW